jgi:hypothetical protein
MTRCEKELFAKLAIARIIKAGNVMTPQSMWSPTTVHGVIQQIDSELTQSTFTAADLISVSGLILAGKGSRACSGPLPPDYDPEMGIMSGGGGPW